MSNLHDVSRDPQSMSPDDFDASGSNFKAPIPPHERHWRHPSELRQQIESSVNIPPLQRDFRYVAIGSACLSVVISLILLRSVIPRPSSIIAEQGLTLRTTEITIQMPIGSPLTADIHSLVSHSRDTLRAVLAMNQDGYFLSSAFNMRQNSIIGIIDIDGIEIPTQVVYIDPQFGIAWLRSLNIDSMYPTESLTISPPTTATAKIAHGDVVWIIDKEITPAIIGLSTKNSVITNDLWPLDTPPGTKFSGLTVDKQGRAIGWCVYIKGGHWVIPMAMLENFLRQVDIASSYERQP